MKPSTEEWLYILLWTADQLTRPTWHNLTQGFEAWAWRSGLGREIADLERRKLLERSTDDLHHATVRLTHAGRLAALGGSDPETQWLREWDGRWRMIVFDVPIDQNALRKRLWRNLRRHGFGYLQNSVWLTPDPIDRAKIAAASQLPTVEMIIALEARPAGGESDSAIVECSWDFEWINAGYSAYLSTVAAFNWDGVSFADLRARAEVERVAWLRAIRRDPFLPAALLPRNYLGRCAWHERQSVCGRLAAALSATAPKP